MSLIVALFIFFAFDDFRLFLIVCKWFFLSHRKDTAGNMVILLLCVFRCAYWHIADEKGKETVDFPLRAVELNFPFVHI